jgi:HSP20 family protein
LPFRSNLKTVPIVEKLSASELEASLMHINVRRQGRGYADGCNSIGGYVMAQPSNKVPVKNEQSPAPALQAWHPFESLRREVDRLFEDFDGGPWRSAFRRSLFDIEPFRRAEVAFGKVPAVDVTETDKAYEITAELPGMDEKNVEVKLANGVLSIKGEKQEDKEEKEKDYYLRERSFGSFERSFQVPDGVNADKIEANFKKGVLTLTLPKSAEAQNAEKKITVKGS